MSNVERLFSTLDRIADALEIIANQLQPQTRQNGGEVISKGLENEFREQEPTIGETATSSESCNEVSSGEKIIEFLAANNIQVKNVMADEKISPSIENLSEFMGQRYSKIKKLLDPIKRSVNTGMFINLDLRNASQEEVSTLCHFGKALYDIAYLSEYRYLKSPRYMLSCLPNRIPQAINFVNGKWLEIYIKKIILKFVEQVPGVKSYSILANPQIVLGNGDGFELDILLQIDDKYFWIEAKTGEYQNYVDRYSKMGAMLGIPEERRYLVLAEMNPGSASQLNTLFKMQVTDIEGFSGTFLNKLAEYYRIE